MFHQTCILAKKMCVTGVVPKIIFYYYVLPYISYLINLRCNFRKGSWLEGKWRCPRLNLLIIQALWR